MNDRTARTSPVDAIEPQLERSLRLAVGLGVLLVALLPAARGSSEWLGWLPMWLVAMPATAWWALHRFRMPGSLQAMRSRRAAPVRRRRPGAQARRRLPGQARLPRAA